MKRNQLIKNTEQQLKSRRDALRRALAGDIAVLRAKHEGGVGDEIDDAIASEQAELRSQMASYESRELAQIEHALEKIRRGRYGLCEVCEQPISPLRLKALPYATECITCARREERRAAGPTPHMPTNRIRSFTEEDRDPTLDEAYEEIG
jgi:DnaK suppressor protein